MAALGKPPESNLQRFLSAQAELPTGIIAPEDLVYDTALGRRALTRHESAPQPLLIRTKYHNLITEIKPLAPHPASPEAHHAGSAEPLHGAVALNRTAPYSLALESTASGCYTRRASLGADADSMALSSSMNFPANTVAPQVRDVRFRLDAESKKLEISAE